MRQTLLNPKELGRWFSQLALASVLALASTGCVSTFKEVNPTATGQPPKEKPSILMVGEIKATDARLTETEQKVMIQSFGLGVQKWCAEHKSFEVRRDVPLTNAPANAIVLSGNITEVEKGSAAARFWVGMGAGQERVKGEFRIDSNDGQKLTSFAARKSYLGGQGIGGFDMLKIADLVDQLGQLVAETTDKWVRGEKIQ